MLLATATALTAAVIAPTTSQAASSVPDHITKTTHGVSKSAVAAAKKYRPRDNFTATWKRADALKVNADPTTTNPRVPENFPVMTDRVWIWDTWPLTDLQTRPITYKGWKVIFSLTAPRNIPFGDRHWQARIGFFYSKTGTASD